MSTTTRPYSLPPRMPIPSVLIGAAIAAGRVPQLSRARSRYGPAVTFRIPGVMNVVSVTDPALVKQVFTAPPDVLYGGKDSPLSTVLGPNSSFGLDEDDHLRARRVILPPFHGSRMAGYEEIVVEETLREMASWPVDEDFESLTPMMRITLNVILRAVFGAQDDEFDELRALLPDMVKLGSFMTAALPLQRDLGPWSPWGRFVKMRQSYDAIVDRLIAAGRADDNVHERQDVLGMLLQARYDDGEPMSRDEIADQMLAMLTAGHETTAATLAWAVERLRRHPALLQRLTAEAHADGKELREATIRELQRTRPVIAGTGRITVKDFELGEWFLPPDTLVQIEAMSLHHDPERYPEPERFEPDRWLGTTPDTYSWVPYGGGRRRCVGAAFAHMEMDIVLKTMLQHCTLTPTSEPDEPWRFRGVAFQPRHGGRARLRDKRLASPSSAGATSASRPRAVTEMAPARA